MTHSTQNRSRPHILVVTVSLIAACLLLTTASWAAANPPMPAMPRTSGGEPRERVHRVDRFTTGQAAPSGRGGR